jgi:hypothetical protein
MEDWGQRVSGSAGGAGRVRGDDAQGCNEAGENLGLAGVAAKEVVGCVMSDLQGREEEIEGERPKTSACK